MKRHKIPTMVKNEKKIRLRREQILNASRDPFKEKGYERTTTREIAENAGISLGAIYEYVGSKEDILYLFFEALYDQLNDMLEERVKNNLSGIERLKAFVNEYFHVIDQISDQTTIMYRESRSLPKHYFDYVLAKEKEFVQYVKEIIMKAFEEEGIEVDDETVFLLTHNLIVEGHMWAFRGWALKKVFTLEKYIALQTELMIQSIHGMDKDK
ncbi:MAG TPA: TetR/AcrR family transcriptional regulator [Bacilli bacterium]|nr:TetR/AcrR family transcriptional regulator [Bacilli bacterium]